MAERRVRFRVTKPYEIVDSLDELQGPAVGVLTPPVDVHWSRLQTDFDVANDRHRWRLYQATLSNGRREHLTAILNRDLLIADWPYLALDARIIDLRSARFPELAARRRRET